MSLFDVPQEVLNARPKGAKDFDFLQGRWLIHHKKLAERLVGCQTWRSLKPLLLTNSSLADLEILTTVDLSQAIFMKVFLFACLTRVPDFGAFIGWIQMAQLCFLQLKVPSPTQSDSFADTISITVSLSS